jgi:uncharacterized protein YecE (DUF72 family)
MVIATRPTELDEWAGRIRGWAANGNVYAYFSDWEGFAIRNALALKEQLGFRLTARS